MATYGPKLSMAALLASFMFSLFLIHHKVACDDKPDKDNKAIQNDKEALLKFINAVEKSTDVNWDKNTEVCSAWKGIKCDRSKSFVTWIQLPSKSLLKQIPDDTIGRLKYLRVLSLHGNGLTGHIPRDFSDLQYLIQFELHSNNFTGLLPYINMTNMDSRNFNVSNNNLSGAIPSSLSKCDKSSFTQTKLCGPPLNNPCPNGTARAPEPSTPAPVSSPGNKPENKLPKGARIGIAVGSPLLVIFFLSCLRKDIHLQQRAQIPAESSDKLIEGGPEPGRANKVEDGIYSFGLEDLLWSSAADLGEGRIGSTYKALMIKEGAVVVVKSLKDVVVTKKDFESHIKTLGKMKNQNVVPLRAYHWSEDVKLLVYDYMPAGSVYDLLHGSKGSAGQTPLDWNERMQIALSAARGLAYLHVTEIVHGNFKSSNILLRQEAKKETAVSDYGLNVLFARSNFPIVTLKSDVYSFGVFLLELLTRKVPNQALLGEEGIDLPRWVESFAREADWKTKVFDTELMRYQDVEEMMVQLLEIAMACASIVLDQRPPMHEVVRMMEHMNPNTPSIVMPPAWE